MRRTKLGSRSRGVLTAVACSAILGGCSLLANFGPTPEPVGCTLEPVTGTLVLEGGVLLLRNAALFGNLADPLPVRWPQGWQVVLGSDGASLFDARGKLQGQAGSTVAVYAQSETGSPLIENGVLVACPMDVFQGHWPPPQ
jgi:hypothetical protein